MLQTERVVECVVEFLWFQSVWSGEGPNTLLSYFWFALRPQSLKGTAPSHRLCGPINLSDLLCFLVFAHEVDVDPQAEDAHSER